MPFAWRPVGFFGDKLVGVEGQTVENLLYGGMRIGFAVVGFFRSRRIPILRAHCIFEPPGRAGSDQSSCRSTGLF